MSLLEQRLSLNHNSTMEEPEVNRSFRPNRNPGQTIQPTRQNTSSGRANQYQEFLNQTGMMEDSFEPIDEEVIALKEQWEKEQDTRHLVFLTRLMNGLFIVGCIYLIFLIFGVSVTSFQYSDSGKVEPQVLGIKDIQAKKDFDLIKVEYEKCQMEYEKLLILNYRLEHSENIQKDATEYKALGDEIRNLYKKEQGLVVKAEYEPVCLLMQNFLNTCQLYCDKIASGYTANNQNDINDSVVLWNGGGVDQNGNEEVGVQNRFILLHQNIVSMGEGLKGVDMIDIKQWRPDTYVDEYINGKESKNGQE